MYEEILNSLIWYYTKANNSFTAILNTYPPTTEDHLRLHYGIYIESIISAVDHMIDCKYLNNAKIYEVISKEEFNYLRQLRNSIIHRGFNVCTECSIQSNFFYFRTPQKVFDNHKKETTPPSEPFLIVFLLKIDILIRNIIHEQVNDLGLLEYKEVSVSDMFNGLAKGIEEHPHIPLEIKDIFFSNTDAIRESIKPKEIHDSLILNYHRAINLENMVESLRNILQNLNKIAETFN